MSGLFNNLKDLLLKVKTSLSKPDKIHAAPVQKDDVTPRISPQTVIEEGVAFVITEGSPPAESPKNFDIIQISENVVERVVESLVKSVEPVIEVVERVVESVVEPVVERVVEVVEAVEPIVEPVVEVVEPVVSVVEAVSVVEVVESVELEESVEVADYISDVHGHQVITEGIDSPVDSALSSLD